MLLWSLIGLLTLAQLSSALLNFGGGSNAKALKSKILELAETTSRGLTETKEQRTEMLDMFERLEKLNPTKKVLADPKTSGRWLLRYTTSDSILGRGGSPRIGEIVQVLDTKGLKASNSETVKYGPFSVARKVKAELNPISSSEVAVQFKQFLFGSPNPFLTVPAPESFKGRLDVTYVDADLRLSRGDKGNIFVLVKESDDVSL